MQYLSFSWQGNSASGTTLGVTANQHVSANIALVAVASDNTSTGADGDNSEVSGISDTASHTWTKVGEYTNTEGAAAAGATISLWMATLKPSNAGKSTTFTATWVSTRAARNVIVYFFKSDTESSWAVAEVLTAATDASTNYGSLTNSALSSKQRLYLRVSAQESSSTGTYTPTSGFTQLAGNIQSTTGMGVRGEFKVATSTGETSNPTNSFASDTASVYVAFEDDPVGGEQRATQVVPVSVTTTLLVATDAEVTQISGTSIGIASGREAEVTQISATSIGIVEGRADNVTQIVMYSITDAPQGIFVDPNILGITARDSILEQSFGFNIDKAILGLTAAPVNLGQAGFLVDQKTFGIYSREVSFIPTYNPDPDPEELIVTKTTIGIYGNNTLLQSDSVLEINSVNLGTTARDVLLGSTGFIINKATLGIYTRQVGFIPAYDPPVVNDCCCTNGLSRRISRRITKHLARPLTGEPGECCP